MAAVSGLKVNRKKEVPLYLHFQIKNNSLIMSKEPTYNEAMAEMEEILEKIEDGELDVDELSGKVKRASELLRLCQSKLRDTEEEIDKIIDEME